MRSFAGPTTSSTDDEIFFFFGDERAKRSRFSVKIIW